MEGEDVGEERELFLTLLSSPPPSLLSSPFPPETPVLRLAHKSHKGEERGTISATIFPSPPPLTFRRKDAGNRWLSLHAYMLYPKPGIVNSLLSLLVHYSELIFVKAK